MWFVDRRLRVTLLILESTELTFVHTSLVQILSEPKRFWLIRHALLLDASPQLILQFVADLSKRIHASFVIRNIGGLQETAASEIIKVVTGFHLDVHVLQYSGGWCSTRLTQIRSLQGPMHAEMKWLTSDVCIYCVSIPVKVLLNRNFIFYHCFTVCLYYLELHFCVHRTYEILWQDLLLTRMDTFRSIAYVFVAGWSSIYDMNTFVGLISV